MAKKPVKSAAKKVATPSKKAAPKKAKAASPAQIEKVCVDALARLKSLKLEIGLQGDIEWCLGSYRFDKNPSGLYLMAEKSLEIFKDAAKGNPKAVPAKLLNDLEKAIATQKS
jgi:hypothetical protein